MLNTFRPWRLLVAIAAGLRRRRRFLKSIVKPWRAGSEPPRTHVSLRGGLTTRVCRAEFKKRTLRIVTRATAEGRLEQFTLSAE